MIKFKLINNKKEWDSQIMNCSKTNLLQTWEYGEAKQRVQKLNVERYLIINDKQPVGMVQVLIKIIPLIGKFVRINRGPLLFNEYYDKIELIKAIFHGLRDYWTKQRKAVLYIAPNLTKELVNQENLQFNGYNSTKMNSWSSSFVNLTSSQEELFANLHKKWRNLLRKAQKSNLEIEFDNSTKSLDYILVQFHEMQNKKKFLGPPCNLLRALHNSLDKEKQAVIIYAVHNGKRVAGIMSPCIANCGHYLLGWNTDEGNKLCANYLLLWQSILLSKQKGCQWFDLGGINEQKTPSIAHFKNGLCGKNYSLIGEFSVCKSNISNYILKIIIKLARK